jgi:hypothetical protein
VLGYVSERAGLEVGEPKLVIYAIIVIGQQVGG